jgi:hypothetical protein
MPRGSHSKCGGPGNYVSGDHASWWSQQALRTKQLAVQRHASSAWPHKRPIFPHARASAPSAADQQLDAVDIDRPRPDIDSDLPSARRISILSRVQQTVVCAT